MTDEEKAEFLRRVKVEASMCPEMRDKVYDEEHDWFVVSLRHVGSEGIKACEGFPLRMLAERDMSDMISLRHRFNNDMRSALVGVPKGSSLGDVFAWFDTMPLEKRMDFYNKQAKRL